MPDRVSAVIDGCLWDHPIPVDSCSTCSSDYHADCATHPFRTGPAPVRADPPANLLDRWLCVGDALLAFLDDHRTLLPNTARRVNVRDALLDALIATRGVDPDPFEETAFNAQLARLRARDAAERAEHDAYFAAVAAARSAGTAA